MKTKIKRHSRSVLAVVLTLCMLVSCMTVGIIATDAAKTADERVGAAGDWYIVGNVAGANNWSERDAVKLSAVTGGYSISVQLEKDKDFRLRHNDKDYGAASDSDSDRKVSSSTSNHTLSQRSSTFIWTGNPGTYTVTINSDGSKISFDGSVPGEGEGGGESGGGDEPTPSGETTTDTPTNTTSGKTLIVVYDPAQLWTRVHVWGGTSIDGTTTAGNMSNITVSNSKKVYYKDLSSNTITGAMSFKAKQASTWDGESVESGGSGFVKGKQWQLYGKYDSHSNKGDGEQAEYTPLTLSNVERPTTITQGEQASFTVNVDGGVPKFLSDKSTGQSHNYTLSVGTTAGGTQVLNAQTFDYTAKKKTFDWTPSSSGSVTLYYTLTDGIDSVTYSKAYTVIQPEATHAVTITSNPSAGGSVSPASGTEIGEVTATQIEATPSAGYEFSSWTFGTGITCESPSTNPTTITTNSSGEYTVQANFTAKPTHTITVNTNNSAYGTASASVASAYQGQEVTLTATESTGTFSSWTVNSGEVTVSGNTKTATFTMGSSNVTITANFDEYTAASPFYYNSYGSNGQPAGTHYGAQMTEAKLNGETFSYYHVTGRTEDNQLFTVSYGTPKYNSYNTYFEIYKSWENGGVSAQFYATDGKNLGGWAGMTFDGEDGDKKRFKIAIPDGAREVKFRNDNGGTDTTGKLSLASGNNAWYNSGSNFNDVTGYVVGSNPVPVNFYENFYSAKYTNAFSTNGFNSHYADRGENHGYTKPKGLDNTTKGDYYIVVLYENKTYTINGVTKKITNNPEIIWMSELPTAVEDTTETVDIYAKNGTLRDSTFNRFTNLADTDFDTTYFEYTESLDSGVYTYRSITDYNNEHSKKITYDNAVSGYNSDYAIMRNVPIGAKIKIKTTLSNDSNKAGSFNNTAFKDTHYLKAYSFNGMSYQVNTPNSEGVYEEIWTVRDVNTKSVSGSTVTNLTKDGKTIEVTPIYYMKDNTNCKTFYIDGYDGTVQNAWGNMLCVYPYYEGMSNKDNAFGGYPGQPMLFWGGKYQMEIPLTVDGTASGASVKGLTLHNSYWDLLHRNLDIRCNTRNHAQTYDYDDFYKLYKEKNPDTIIFDFKYRTTKDNFGDRYNYTDYTTHDTTASATTYSGNEYNGVELVTDYFGRQVDAFGTLIADNKKSDYDSTHSQDKELLFVSTGFKDTYVGEYATLWAVYAPQSEIPDVEEGDTKDTAGKFIGYISSSMLYLNNWDRRLQYTGGDDSSNGRMSWSEFEKTYNWLKKYYTGVPALISYEKEIWNDSKDKAYRSDGKWYYSNKGDQISSNIIIQYNSDPTQSAAIVASKDKALTQDVWTTDAFSSTAGVGGQNNIGSTTGCAAYFTNTSPNLLGKVNSGTQFADSTKSFTFRADAGGSYMFVNWVRLSNGKYYEISEKELAESVMSSNDTYIARFVKSASGSLKISHVVEQNGTYKGTGTPAVTVTVKNGSDLQVLSQTSTDGTPIDISSYIQTKYSAYKIDISLSTTPDEDCTLQEIVTSAAQKYRPGAISSNAATVTTFTVHDIIEGNVSTLRYVSHLTKTVFRYNYEITYTYYSRFWGEQSYTQTGTCEDGDFTGSKTGAKLTTDFIIGKTPYEKSFRQQINWNYTTTAVPAASGTGNVGASAMENNVATDQGSNTYKMTAHVYASKTVNDKVTAEFVLPYKYNEKAQGYTVKDTDVYNSSGTKSGTSYLYDSGNESVTLTTQAYKLFTYDGSDQGGSDNTLASSLPLMEAAPYLMTNLGDNDYHYKLTDNMRYYTGNSFKVGDTTYYLDTRPDDADDGGKYVIMDSHNPTGAPSVEFLKVKHNKEGDMQKTTYHYAVADTTDGQEGEYGYKIYFFSYVTDDFGNYVDNEGNSVNSPIFNGQYCVYSVGREKDGIIEGKGSKKYFTRWDIFNTKGDFVASCFNRRFSYSGYDNYVVRPVYASDTENSYASSLGDGYKSTITYLDDSRNQWKGTGASGNYNSVTHLNDANYAGDKIFTDFAITYAYEGRNINTVSSDEAKIRVGMVIEKLDALDTVGSTTITDASYYANKYKGDTDWTALSTALAGGTSLTSAVKTAGGESSAGHSCFNSKIAANYDETGYTRFGSAAPGATSGQESVVDNFNRLQWFYTFNNSTKTTAEAAEVEGTMKNYAFRAISYIIVEKNGTKTATLTDTPVYFTIYDTATRAHN